VSGEPSTLTYRGKIVRLLRKISPTVIYVLIANYFISQTTLSRGEDRIGEATCTSDFRKKSCQQYFLTNTKHTSFLLNNSSTVFKTYLC